MAMVGFYFSTNIQRLLSCDRKKIHLGFTFLKTGIQNGNFYNCLNKMVLSKLHQREGNCLMSSIFCQNSFLMTRAARANKGLVALSGK